MKTTGKIISLFILLSLLPVPTGTAMAQGLSNGQVIFGSTFNLPSGETLNGDLVVIGGAATIEAGATVTGDVILVGGNLTIHGSVSGDVVLVGGAGTLGKEAVISRDLITVASAFAREDGSVVKGEVFISSGLPFVMAGPDRIPTPPRVEININPLVQVATLFFRAFALAALAVLLLMFVPQHAERIAQSVVAQPLATGGLGLMTMLIAPVILVFLAITIILIPVSLVGIFVLALAVLFGWIALGLEVGQRFTRMINQEWALPLSAGVGTFLLTLVTGVIGFVPCIGWLATFLVTLLALGGTLLTLFGSRMYQPVMTAMPVSTGEDES